MTARVRVGIGGWTYEDWRGGAFYPAGWPQARELEYASQRVTTIEINSTFYGPQKPATFAKWRDQTPDDFVFSVKAPKLISQRRTLADAGAAVERFIGGGIEELGDKLGPIVWQLAPGRPFDADDLGAFLAQLPQRLGARELHHVLDLQHASFQCAEYLELVRRHRVGSVFTDSAKHGTFADLSGGVVYLQLRNTRAELPQGYTEDELRQWAERAAAWAAGGEPADLPHLAPPSPPGTPRAVHVLFINGAKERNPAAAMALRQLLDAR
ncbi:MAG: DUF72 domain-containing protein [Piscinibacter sp.]|nr:DUF72 domain-containing protein [Piscinibacter sp.]